MTEIDIFYEGELSTRCVHLDNGAIIHTDAPKDNRGKGELFSPTDFFSASLGSCLLTVMAIQAEKWNVDLKGARVNVKKEMVSGKERRVKKLCISFTCPANPAEEIKKQLEEVARHCPVHRSIHPEIEQVFLFEWGKSEI